MAANDEVLESTLAPMGDAGDEQWLEHDPRDVAHLHEAADFDWVATPDFVPLRGPRVATVEADGQLVITHVEAPNVMRLDRVTSLLWRSFDDGVTVRELAEDVADAFAIESDVALAKMIETATNLGRAGFLTEPPRPPILRRRRVYDVGVDTCAGKKLGLARIDPDAGVVLDLGEQLLRLTATDPVAADWLRVPFAEHLVAGDDRRLVRPVEHVVANFGVPAPNRRSRHRLLDHDGNLWFSTFDSAEAAEALARAGQDRLDAADGGTWLRLPVLVPAVVDRSQPVPALVLHPWLSLSIDRLLPGLRRLGVAVHPSPLVRYEPTDGTFSVRASPRLAAPLLDEPGDSSSGAIEGAGPAAAIGSLPTADGCTLAPVAMVAVWDDLDRAQVIELFASGAVRWDQAHLDAVADLAARTPYERLDATKGLRCTTRQLAAMLAVP